MGKNYILLAFLFFAINSGLSSQNQQTFHKSAEIPGTEQHNNSSASKYLISEKGDTAFTVVEIMPEFPGGAEALMRFLSSNIHYPQQAREYEIQGTVYVTFLIKANGSITDIKILRGIGGGCDEECIRIVRDMPPWLPGKQDGKAVAVQFNMPIKFTLQGSPSKPDNNFEKGIYLMQKNNYAKAKTKFSKSIDYQSQLYREAYLNRGICNFKLGDFNNSISDIAKAKELQAESADSVIIVVFYSIAREYLEQQRFEQAISLFSNVIAINKTDKDSYFGRGLSYFSSGNMSKACSDFLRAKELGYEDAAGMAAKCCIQ